MTNEVTIHRKTEKEALQAISDLQKRGFVITYDLTERKVIGTSSGDYDYRKGKYTAIKAYSSSVWFAKLRRGEQDGLPHGS